MKLKALAIVVILLSSSTAFAQRYVVDTSFAPFFDFYPMGKDGEIFNILESHTNGKLWILGDFDFTNGVRHLGITSLNKDGSRNPNFIGSSGGSNLIYMSDSSFLNTSVTGLKYLQQDTTGRIINKSSSDNFRKTVPCSESSHPYIFNDGSILAVNTFGNFGACDIINPPDTFPHRYIIKVTPDGLWDSTFTHESNDVVQGFLPYDSNRLWVYGLSRRFQYYDSVYVHGLCRIYTDGRLDTTFTNPFQDRTGQGLDQFWRIQETLPDGDVLIGGSVYLKGDTVPTSLIRLNADGSVDTTFKTDHPSTSIFPQGSLVYSAAPTADGGFLIGGIFDQYQGHAANCIAKLDSNGTIDTNAILFRGPDSAANAGSGRQAIYKIISSKFGGYYLVGDFKLWDSLPTNPIKRLVLDKTVGLNEELRITNNSIDLFPNPTSGLLNIRLSANTQIKQLQLFDLVGKVQKVKWQKNQLDLSPLRNGIYFLKVQLNDGQTLSRKIIKN